MTQYSVQTAPPCRSTLVFAQPCSGGQAAVVLDPIGFGLSRCAARLPF